MSTVTETTGQATGQVAWLPGTSPDHTGSASPAGVEPSGQQLGHRAAPSRATLSTAQWATTWAVGVLTSLLGVLGLVVSFETVSTTVEPYFGAGLAWTVPIAIDLGIAVLAALDALLALLGMPVRWLRPMIWTLVAAMISLNVLGQDTVIGIIAHAGAASLWVVAVEAGLYVARRWLGMTHQQRARLDRIRLSRWLLAPVSTVAIWRRMVLWEETSYTNALARERRRRRVLADLRAKHGAIAWRWKAPVRDRIAYRFDELTPTSSAATTTTAASAPATTGQATSAPAATDGASARPRPAASDRTERSFGSGQAKGTRSGEPATPAATGAASREVTGADIHAAQAARPAATQHEIAAELGISVRTLRRRLAATDPTAHDERSA